tara:strand:+ start:10893 stop:12110 length:1218 start_codon:yes stop_codon:yes gene_type:complete
MKEEIILRRSGDNMTVYEKKDVSQLVRDYYSTIDFDIPDIQRREIAFQNWKEVGIRDRHRYFQTNEDLKAYLSKIPKAAVFHSVGYYLDPLEREFAKKSLQGFDFIFDIDADNLTGKGYVEKLGDLCMMAKRLIDNFLVGHFGIPKEDIRIEFSGRKGLHLTILGDKYRYLSKTARRELVEYIEGTKLDRTILFPEKKGYVLSEPNSKGWRGEGRAFIEDLLKETEGKTAKEIEGILQEHKLPKVQSKKISALLTQPKIRQTVLEGRLSPLMGKGAVTLNSLSGAVMKKHGVGLGSIIANMKKKKTKYEFDGKIIDRAVTYDAHRILRIPKSIHPKSGFPCITISYEQLADPLEIFDEISKLVGHDLITIKLAKPVYLEADEVLDLEAGEHLLPRYLGLAALIQS